MVAFSSEVVGSYVSRDVTELLRQAISAGLPAFGIAFNGECNDGTADFWRSGAINDDDVNNRPYLKIYTAN